jgi:ketosteroid isomerase-like protein
LGIVGWRAVLIATLGACGLREGDATSGRVAALDSAATHQALDAVEARIVESIGHRDPQALRSLLASDALVITAGDRVLRGRDVIAAAAGALTDASAGRIQVTPESVTLTSYGAVATGTALVGAPVEWKGVARHIGYVSVWKRQPDGRLQMVLAIQRP